MKMKPCFAPGPCSLIIFGATGDLTKRKLMPALYNLEKQQCLSSDFRIYAFARKNKTQDSYREEIHQWLLEENKNNFDKEAWRRLSEKIIYHHSEFNDPQGYQSLKKRLDSREKKNKPSTKIFFLATHTNHFACISEHLYKYVHRSSSEKEKRFRLVMEKPFGTNLQSASALQEILLKYFSEEQIYRIDHYLAKETVQNLLIFRFSNCIFESLWNKDHIDHVQITVAEEMGIHKRGAFYEKSGILRDVIQNHMLQLLSLVAMEPPSDLNALSIHNEKVKLLKAICPLKQEDISSQIIRGQYGVSLDEKLCAYRQEKDVHPQSSVETFAAMQLYIDNKRWQGVPFYLRAGKRLGKRSTHIAIIFKKTPCTLFQHRENDREHNILVIRIQPNEGISLHINCKTPGMEVPATIQPVHMDFCYNRHFSQSAPSAYERLICDLISGDSTLFARGDEVLTSWKLLDPLLKYWEKTPPQFPNYPSGSWGPKTSNDLLEQSGRYWV